MRASLQFCAVLAVLAGTLGGLRFTAAARAGEQLANSAALKSLFAKPTRDYSTAPLWVWNDDLSRDDVVSTLRDLAGQEIKQVFIHPRPGLMTPYMSDKWFELWRAALDEARRLDMNVWIYDENSYPSGFAGGHVPDQMPQSRGRGIALREQPAPPSLNDSIIAVFQLQTPPATAGGSAPETAAGTGAPEYEQVTEALRGGTVTPGGPYLVFTLERAADSPWHGGRCYVDLLQPGVTEKFISVTLEAYRREVGREFGDRVPGVFTDEPNLRSAGQLPWTEELPALFQERWGYDLRDCLPALWKRTGDWKQVRHDYYQLLLEQFIERWARPMSEFCARHNLEFTGHYWEHEWTSHAFVPDNMAMYAWHQRPAIDTLFNQYDEGVHAQFGNVRAVKELSSIANQLGCPRTLCEAYGGGGWDIRFEDLKRIGDWLYVLGVNTLDQHLSHISIRGARKRDYPQSFSYHEPWWPAYHEQAAYFARLSAALSVGQERNRILVLEPTTTLWLYTTEPVDPYAEQVAAAFQMLITGLSKQQVEYDLGCEYVMAQNGDVRGAALHIGDRPYDTVVLPPMLETLNTDSVDLLERFLKAGGTLLSCSPPPALVDGQPSDRPARLARNTHWKQVQPDALAQTLLAAAKDDLRVTPASGSRGILYHLRRQLDDGDLVFLANTSIDVPAAGRIAAPAAGVEEWKPHTGEVAAYPFESGDAGVTAAFELPPCGSVLLFVSKNARQSGLPPAAAARIIDPDGPPEIKRTDPNVLVLDFVDVEAAGQRLMDVYFYPAGQFVFQKNGLERNPWDNGVQFRDEIISRTFPASSGFEATYRFTIEDRVPAELFAVVERADLYAVTCNGEAVKPVPDGWWLDRSFRKLDIAAAARVGENELTLKAAPFTVYHELEAAYIIGGFRLRPTEAGFTIIADQPLELGPWDKRGAPLYGHSVAYTERFNISSPHGRYEVALPAWYGSVATVQVNGRAAGCIYNQPWQLDITDAVQSGANTVEVTVIGTLKNTLGPHHGNPPLGIAGPGSFQRAPQTGPPPGERYSTVGYGLFQPFVLKCTAE